MVVANHNYHCDVEDFNVWCDEMIHTPTDARKGKYYAMTASSVQ